MTTLRTLTPRRSSRVERLRVLAREFADALPSPNPLQDPSWARAFWPVLLALVVDESVIADDLTDDLVLGIYATAVAAEFLEYEFALNGASL